MSSSFHDAFEKRKEELTFDIDLHERREKRIHEVSSEIPQYLIRLGREPVALSLIEYLIVQFLSRRPYKAYTPEEIVRAVHSTEHPVTTEGLPQYIRTLRGKLGLFSDYIQSVPYIGYRFKP